MDEFEPFDMQNFDDEYNKLEDTIPEGLCTPFAYWMFVMPILPPKKTAGGILLPESAQDGLDFMNPIGRVAKMGDGCYTNPKYGEKGLNLKRLPQVGDIIRYAGTNNRKWSFKGVWFVDIRDDMVRAIIGDETTIRDYKFHK